MPRGYLYTHKARAVGVGGPVVGKQLTVELYRTRNRKRWQAKDIGNFNLQGGDNIWFRLDINTLRRL